MFVQRDPKTPHQPVYDRLARHYDSVMAPFDRCFLARRRKQAAGALPENGAILELGAGSGLNAAYLSNRTSVVASDLSRKMLEIARTRNWPAGVDIVQCDAESLPFADDSFDAALATLVFCSIPSPANSFKELRRVLKPGGIVVLLEHVRPPNILGPLFDILNVFTVRIFEDHFNRKTAIDAQLAGLEILSLNSHAFGIFQVIICRVND